MERKKKKSKLEITSHILDILFPPICVNCKTRIKKQKHILCEKCFNKLQINDSFYCPICFNRKPSYINDCHQTPFILAPATFYNEPIPALIHYYKYKKIKNIQNILSALLITYINNINIDVKKFQFSYIPIHTIKKRNRGFNQSEEIAKNLSTYLNVPLLKTLYKNTNNQPQAKMNSPEKRLTNVKNTLTIATDEKNIKGKNIILVDDVSTSGATLYEASKILKTMGARKIIGLVVSKAQ